MLAHQHRDQRGRRWSKSVDPERAILDAENQGAFHHDAHPPTAIIAALGAFDATDASCASEAAQDDYAAFDKIYRSEDAPVVAGKSDMRSRADVLKALSEGSYEKEYMQQLFAQGLESGSLTQFEQADPGRGWARKEAIVKNELRTILRSDPVANVATLYRGLAMSRQQYQHMMDAGRVQNHRLSFLSSSRSVAEYFASTSPGEVRVIFELDCRNLPAGAALHKGKVAADQYEQIIRDSKIKFDRADLAGLVEAIAIPGHVFQVTGADKAKPRNKLGNLFARKSGSAAERDTMLVRLQLVRRTLRPIAQAHSPHF